MIRQNNRKVTSKYSMGLGSGLCYAGPVEWRRTGFGMIYDPIRIICLGLLLVLGGCKLLAAPPDNTTNPMAGQPSAVQQALQGAISSPTAAAIESGVAQQQPVNQPAPGLTPNPLLNPGQFDAELNIDTAVTRPANRNILGNNTQWVDSGDNLLVWNTLNFDTVKTNLAKTMGVSFLRYPGGTHADLYHFTNGLGPIGSRKKNLRGVGPGDDTVLFGTVEFLELAVFLGAEPMVTVNLHTGTAQEAADWVTLINVTGLKDRNGNNLPKVRYWEIGNEPYLKNPDHPSVDITPTEYAKRANDFIQAMKAVDPTIKVGIVLRSDTLAGTAATPFPGFNNTVLGDMVQPFEFVALHNAYFPFIFEPAPSVTTMYQAAMSSAQFVEDDINATRTQLNNFFPGQNFEISITEYNAFFTLNQGFNDGFLSSLMGGLYVADVMTLFANLSTVHSAMLWSITSNGFFGAIRNDNQLRPAYHVLEGFNRILNGQVLGNTVTSPLYPGAKAGFIPDNPGMPAISAVVTRNGGKLWAFVTNKHLDEEARLTIKLAGGQSLKTLRTQTLTTNSIVPDDVSIPGWSAFTSRSASSPVNVSPHTMMIMEMELN